MYRHLCYCLVFAGLPALSLQAADANPTIKDVMLNVVTPLTDTIWGIEDPQSDEEWQVFLDATAKLLTTMDVIRTGGADGPARADDAEWQHNIDVFEASVKEVQKAARARDLDAFMNAANDKMYPPCEECHAQYLPGAEQ